MRYYSKNIFRTILKNRGAYIGAVAVITIGVMVYIGMTEFLGNLQQTLDEYCERNLFADIFVTVESMPRGKLDSLLDIEGVDAVFGRLEGDARLLLDGTTEVVTVHLMAWSPDDSMNLITLRPAPDDMTEDTVYIGTKMVDAYDLQPGQTLTLVANNRTRRYTYGGRAYSPEMMYPLPDDYTPAPDNSVYDLGVMRREALEALLGKHSIVTAVGVRLAPGRHYYEVKAELEQKLRPYGLQSMVERKDQDSYNELVNEIKSYEIIIALLPTIFMLVTMFILYVVLKKMVDKDRQLIGTLKAFGASNWEIVSRYLLLGGAIGLAGGVLPIVPGELAGQFLYSDDVSFYSIPFENYQANPGVWAAGFLIAVGTALAALLLGVRDVLSIMPAESMKSAAPGGGAGFQLPPLLDRVLNHRQKIGLRAIFRNRLRSLFIALSIALPFSMIASFASFNDVLDETIYDQFRKADTFQMRVRLSDYVSEDTAVGIIRKLQGVRAAETASTYPVEMTCRNRTVGASMSVMMPNSELRRIMDIENRFFEPRDDGLILSEGYARKLNARVGDVLEVRGEKLTRSGETVKIPIVQLVRVGFGSGCYLSRDGLERYFQMRYQPNSLLLTAEDGQLEQLKEQVNRLRGISFALESERMLYFSEDMMSITVIMLDLLAVFSLVAGVIMIYSIINISMRERQNEFGTLMVLGMRRDEIGEIIAFEQTINFTVGILLGLYFSTLMCRLIEFAVGTDTLSVAMHIRPVVYLITFCICAVATLLSVIFVVRGVLNIQLTEVLKARD